MRRWRFAARGPDGWDELPGTFTGTPAEARAEWARLALEHGEVCGWEITEENTDMTQGLTAIGEAVLMAREGRKLEAYRDSVGIWTIGYGVTRIGGKPVTKGMTITDAECTALFEQTLLPYAATVDSLVRVPLADHERDALVALTYNIGQEGFAGSTVLRKLNAGDRGGAATAMLAWNKGGGRILPGLTARREAEMAQFLTPYTTALPRPTSTQARIKVAVQPAAGAAVHPATVAPVIVPIAPKPAAQGWFGAWVDRVFAPSRLPDLAARG